MKNIEVEIRSFLSETKYQELLAYFKENGELLKEDYQETYYFNCPQDLRIQKNDQYAKIWLKKGEIHDEQREEMEVKIDRDDFANMEKIFLALNYEVEIKWYRKRFKFLWHGINVCLDHTKGYGYIIELEKMCNDEEKENALDELKLKMQELNVEQTEKQVFQQKFEEYKENWQILTANR